MNFLENLGEAIEKTIEMNKQELNNEDSKEINIKDSNISTSEIELAKKLDAIEEFTVDRIEDKIAVLENRKTLKIENVEKEKLPKEIKEGDILNKINGKYFINETRTKEATERIQEKMNKLWK